MHVPDPHPRAAELLSVAEFEEGSFAQAFPTFGSERTGAPVVSYCRIDDREIRIREPIGEPDSVIIQDPTLLHQVDVFSGVAPGAYVLINTSGTVATWASRTRTAVLGRATAAAGPERAGLVP